MRSFEELVAKVEEANRDLTYLRQLGCDKSWRSLSADERRMIRDQEYYLTGYVRALNKQINLQRQYQETRTYVGPRHL